MARSLFVKRKLNNARFHLEPERIFYTCTKNTCVQTREIKDVVCHSLKNRFQIWSLQWRLSVDHVS